MAIPNIEMFNDLTGRILGELYLDFPVPTYLGAETFVESAFHFDENLGMDTLSKDGEFFIATINWLITAGYLNGNVSHDSFVTSAVLTAKGLEILNATPKSLTHGHSLGEKIAEAAKDGAKETLKGLVTEALGLGARFISPMVGVP